MLNRRQILSGLGTMALVAAVITALGFSLVFPALAVQAVSRVTPNNRGAALAMYSVWVDIALGFTGPTGGWVATAFGFPAIYFCAMLCALLGVGICLIPFVKHRRRLNEAIAS